MLENSLNLSVLMFEKNTMMTVSMVLISVRVLCKTPSLRKDELTMFYLGDDIPGTLRAKKKL